MDPLVFAAVLFAAACHAGWNATIKRGLDPLATTVLISIGAAIVSAVLLPFVGLPAPGASRIVLRRGQRQLGFFSAPFHVERARAAAAGALSARRPEAVE